MRIRRQAVEAVRVLVYLLPPSLALLMASPMLLSPFGSERGVGPDYLLVAIPLCLGIVGVPGYVYAFFVQLDGASIRREARNWVRVSLVSALVASAWATAMVGPAWRDILPFVLLPALSTLTSALLLIRFEVDKHGREASSTMERDNDEHGV